MVFAMLFLIAGHAWRQYFFYKLYLLDVTGPMMILTQKVTQLAFSVHDGKETKHEKQNDFQKHYKTDKVPSLLEYFGHVFVFTGFLAGPNHQFRDYKAFIDGSVKAPSCFFVALGKLLVSFVFIGVKFIPGAVFNYNADMNLLIDPTFLATHTLLERIGHLLACAVVIRSSYYFAWTLADGANNTAGLGYHVKNGKAKWDLISNVKVLNVEFATSFKMVLDNWNMQTQTWLKYVCYDRTNSVYITMALSAFWHGLYPGYYLTFLFGAVITNASRKVRSNIRPLFVKEGSGPTVLTRLYDVLTWATTMLYLDFCVGPFVILEVYASLDMWRGFYFAPVVAAFVALLVLPSKKSGPKKEKAAAAAPAAAAETKKSA